uniref:Uncharacterized protein n=1 Tax=Strigamia maritima TaxID=126957 RepID=T1JAN0_STRMM
MKYQQLVMIAFFCLGLSLNEYIFVQGMKDNNGISETDPAKVCDAKDELHCKQVCKMVQSYTPFELDYKCVK